MNEIDTKFLQPDAVGLAVAAELLSDGGLVAFPTETVYGLGVDARNSDAVARLYEAKGRPSFNPLIVHVESLAVAETLVEFDDDALRLASAFWPGALTLVLPLKDGAGISPLVTAGLNTLAVRVPDHALAQSLLAAFGGPIAAPSANPSGQVSPTNFTHVRDQMSGRIDGIVEGGTSGVGLESTIVATRPVPTLLRAGGLPSEAVEAALGQGLAQAGDAAAPNSPGQLASHYAPKGVVRLNAEDVRVGETLLGFGAVEAAINLSSSSDLVEAAANLFDALHQLNALGAEKIAVSPIPEHGLGRAINDRLRRAAAPR
ncbi:L-threonylcarbamoyladenylate synthase [Octadecabacter sp. 1_MG-2023]|uniref:L-threonylcarbamoyladenylate synthase n=1 Tax=unclassified Octadecabacter TaxID=196158 RepID=UPI001C09373C|nr:MULTISPECIES: L-threonylcarbamoyladenylate synthase [unclassified Octadecabacter]MBU2994161.1 threonylcarbamoyl-AMP synthase [Octadecabacter sp. B2R22]MDO6734550.1 L-threonylcarbamoyladenylate synthase [Octadecabacter sp. 1_MG-2023]